MKIYDTIELTEINIIITNKLIELINNQLILMADPEMMSMMDKKDKKKEEDNGKSDAAS